MARLLLGVSGGIAAYKGLETARLAVKAGHSVRVIQTLASERFVGRASFEAITGAPVLIDEFDPDPARGAYPGEPLPGRAPISHLALVEHAAVYLIAPATANTIAKLAHGHADNLLTAAALAATCPVAVAPAMNNQMYEHPATRANLELLSDRGVNLIPPGEGELGSYGEHGVGRLAEPGQLLAAVEALLAPGASRGGAPSGGARPGAARSGGALTGGAPGGTWPGLNVLVTAGGTREPIDSVRFIGNRSSGRMGFALAAEAVHRGADVTVIAANVALEPPAGARLVPVTTTAELVDACEREFARCDVLLMAAAIADWRPAHPAADKLKKDQGVPAIELEPTVDVLGTLAAERTDKQVIVGFAAEHGRERAIAYGREKLERKGLDMIVVNDISQPDIGFEVAENEVTILAADGTTRRVERTSKERVAQILADEVQRLRAGRRERAGGSARAGAGSPARV